MRLDHHCRWVRHRLPLLAGGELGSVESRKVERHLIVCPGCRERQDASAQALDVLHRFAEESPTAVEVDAPSLWPALARQIRQSKHSSPRPSWWELPLPLPRPWAFVTLTTGLGAVLAASIARTPAEPEATAQAPVVATRSPALKPEPEPEVPAPTPSTMPSRRGALPETPLNRLTQGSIKPIEPPSSLRFDYDLDHGTPMTPGNLDPQRTY